MSEINIFMAYAHEDETYQRGLYRQLRVLEHGKKANIWHDGKIIAGQLWDKEIKQQLKAAQIILLLISADFIDSQYCMGEEYARALERHQSGEATVIPIIVDHCYWQAIFELQQFQIPNANQPFTDLTGGQLSQLYTNIVKSIDAAIVQRQKKTIPPTVVPPPSVVVAPPAQVKIPDHFVLIQGGIFTMGSPEKEVDRIKERETQHQVKVSSFYMCQYAVSQAEYRALIGDNPAHFTGNDNLPVEMVTWWDATFYCNKLNRKYGYSPTYDSEGNLLTPEGSITQDIRQVIGFRLPTEAEWEYACRAGTDTPFNTGYNLTTDQANYNGNYPYNENKKGQYRQKTVPVNSFAPNDWKLYNMHGNVWEWCYDWYDENYYNTCKAKGTVENPIGASSGSFRVLRGGCWGDDARYCRSAYRIITAPGNRNRNFGFRLVFVPQFIG